MAPRSFAQKLLLASALATAGCSAVHESSMRADLDRASQRLGASEEGASAQPAPAMLGGSLSGYVSYAMAQSPELRASFERWRAAVLRISQARRLPEPMLGYGLFIQNVETRVGPQNHRLSLQQTFPWPTKLTRGADAAAAAALALEKRFDAAALAVRQRVTTAYYKLWLIRRIRPVQREQSELFRGLSESAAARVAAGNAALSDIQQIDLSRARLEDSISGLDETERTAEADLRAILGAPPGTALPTPEDPPAPELPAEPEDALIKAALTHPLVLSFAHLEEAKLFEAESKEADRYPSFSLQIDWIETGEARMPGVADSGKDAVIAGLGVRVPLWQSSYGDSIQASHAEANAHKAEGRAAADRAAADVAGALAQVRDAERRVRLYRDTLLPQAKAAYESVLGGFATGKATVSAAILAQRDLLELQIGLDRASADHAIAFSRLEMLVGRPVKRGLSAKEPK